jgi:hypothetical protein
MKSMHIIPWFEAPIMIQNPRSEKARGCWNHHLSRAKCGEAELLFNAYFDWNRMGADFRHGHVKIAQPPAAVARVPPNGGLPANAQPESKPASLLPNKKKSTEVLRAVPPENYH